MLKPYYEKPNRRRPNKKSTIFFKWFDHYNLTSKILWEKTKMKEKIIYYIYISILPSCKHDYAFFNTSIIDPLIIPLRTWSLVFMLAILFLLIFGHTSLFRSWPALHWIPRVLLRSIEKSQVYLKRFGLWQIRLYWGIKWMIFFFFNLKGF